MKNSKEITTKEEFNACLMDGGILVHGVPVNMINFTPLLRAYEQAFDEGVEIAATSKLIYDELTRLNNL